MYLYIIKALKGLHSLVVLSSFLHQMSKSHSSSRLLQTQGPHKYACSFIYAMIISSFSSTLAWGIYYTYILKVIIAADWWIKLIFIYFQFPCRSVWHHLETSLNPSDLLQQIESPLLIPTILVLPIGMLIIDKFINYHLIDNIDQLMMN